MTELDTHQCWAEMAWLQIIGTSTG